MRLMTNRRNIWFCMLGVGTVATAGFYFAAVHEAKRLPQEATIAWDIGVPLPESDLTWHLGTKYLVHGTQETGTSSHNGEEKLIQSRWSGTLGIENGTDLSLSAIVEHDDPRLPPSNIDIVGKMFATSVTGCSEWLRIGPAGDLIFLLMSPSCKTDYREPHFANITRLLGETWRGDLVYFPMGVQTNDGKSCQLIRFFVSAAWQPSKTVPQLYHADGIVKIEINTRMMLSAEMNVYSACGTFAAEKFDGKPDQVHRNYLVWRRRLGVVLLAE